MSAIVTRGYLVGSISYVVTAGYDIGAAPVIVTILGGGSLPGSYSLSYSLPGKKAGADSIPGLKTSDSIDGSVN